MMAAGQQTKLDLDAKYDHYDFPTSSPTVQSGHPGHTTPEQNAKVHQLRMSLEQLGYKERLDTLTMVPSPSTIARAHWLTTSSFASFGPGNSTLNTPSKCDYAGLVTVHGRR